MPRHKPVIPPLTTSPVKKYQPYNLKRPKKYADFLGPQSAPESEPSMSKKKGHKHVPAAEVPISQPSRCIEIANASGTMMTQRWGPGIEPTHWWQVPNRHDHVGNAMSADASNVSTPPSTPALKKESPIWEASPQGWLENIAEPTPSGPDTALSPTLLRSASRKWAKRALRNLQKQVAWLHWRHDVIHKVVEIYLGLEAKKAGRVPLAAPSETLYDRNGKLQTPAASLCSHCNTSFQFHSLMTIAFSGATWQTFKYCKCPSNTLPLSIIQSGYFPGSPVTPQVAFHFDVLSLYSALHVDSYTPIASFHAALFAMLQENGYEFTHNIRSICCIEAITWFQALRDSVEVETEREFLLPTSPAAPDAPLCRSALVESTAFTHVAPAHNGDPSVTASHGVMTVNHGIPTSIGTSPDLPLMVHEYPDVIVAMDGNMQHKQYMFVGGEMILPWNETCTFLTDAEIEEAARHISDARAASRGCSESHETWKAVSLKNGYLPFEGPDGNPALSIAMLLALSCQLPSNATIGLMYDVGCVLDRLIAKYNLIPEIAPRLSIAISVFHAYAHQFCCQITFHPWKRNGFGKSNGEGNERLWSLIVDTIVPERIMSPAKRITTINNKIKMIVCCGRDRLASLARSKLAAIVREEALLTDLLQDLKSKRGFTTPFLQSQWEEQKSLQLSVRAYNDQAGMKKFAKLLEAERSAQAHSDALDAVKKELDRISLA
ncbi:uncharacterized protein EI90DRAFT_3119000 [Cantharellus anzutake]|uniref:uncharacterized protein n=1 Tax=Cantharellus anzutake TaxID=1750568 RepID=UPI0019057475|nr:uncharacterized protein EI90DRAFT_3119000 [Cantharellus anzutake]KAF8337552.1 hypothetical protein EI90DRAFT_3119000 [Cantharellus anzutake]